MARILPREEWPRLVGTEAETIWPRITDPDSVRVVVVEHNGEIIGCHLLLMIVHAEGLWIHPAHRGKSSAARRLWTAVQRAARDAFGARWVATATVSEEVRRLLIHVGATELPGRHYVVPIEGK